MISVVEIHFSQSNIFLGQPKIKHRDFKAANILLDNSFEAKVGLQLQLNVNLNPSVNFYSGAKPEEESCFAVC